MSLSVAGGHTEMPKESKSLSKKGEIVGTDEAFEMFYKSGELKKIISNTVSDEELEIRLNRALTKMQTYPEYADISLEDFQYDLNNYFVSPALTIEKIIKGEFSGNNQYYHEIVIPIYLKGKNVDNLYIFFDANFNDNTYVVGSHSSYRGYKKFAETPPEDASIFDFVNKKEDIEELVTVKLGKGIKINKTYLLLGRIDARYHGIQDDSIYVETNKGACVFVSVSCTYALHQVANIKNNTLYTLEEYINEVQPKLYPDLPKQNIEFNEDGTIKWEKVKFGGAVVGTEIQTPKTNNGLFEKELFGIKGGYVFIPAATVLICISSVIIIVLKKKKRRINNI